VGAANVTVASARASSAKREAERGRELADNSKRLSDQGLGSKVSDIESQLAAQKRTDMAREGVAEVSRTAATQALEVKRLALQDVEFTRVLVDAEADLIQLEAQIRTVEASIDRRTVRALVAGYLGEVAPITVGVTVAPGRPLATIIPDGGIQMVAYYVPTEAVGRVHVGQRASLRFHAFPWTEFGIACGDVTSVGVEPRAAEGREPGGIRVEIAMDRTCAPLIPLQHGMPASVEVLVEYATPWQLLMRSVGGVRTPKPDSEAVKKAGGAV
jgi:multidrug resistance efflux pump